VLDTLKKLLFGVTMTALHLNFETLFFNHDLAAMIIILVKLRPDLLEFFGAADESQVNKLSHDLSP